MENIQALIGNPCARCYASNGSIYTEQQDVAQRMERREWSINQHTTTTNDMPMFT